MQQVSPTDKIDPTGVNPRNALSQSAPTRSPDNITPLVIEQRPPAQPPAQPRELEQPTLADFGQILENQENIASLIQTIFQDLHTRVPGGFQSERLVEI